MAIDSNQYLWGSDYCFGCGLGAVEDTKHVIMQCPSRRENGNVLDREKHNQAVRISLSFLPFQKKDVD